MLTDPGESGLSTKCNDRQSSIMFCASGNEAGDLTTLKLLDVSIVHLVWANDKREG